MIHAKRWIKNLIVSILWVSIIVISSFDHCSDATASKETVHTILCTSDVHSRIDNLDSWLKRTAAIGISSPDYMCFGGDYASSYSIEKIEEVRSVLTENYPDTPGIYITGNHEAKDYDAALFEETFGYAASGAVVKEENYSIYTLGAASSKQSFEKTQIEEMKQYLDTLTEEQQKQPVFIISHYPLHTCGKRKTSNASEVVSILNEYPNVIFLYGHNHTKSDPMYGTVQKAGDTITIKEDQDTPIQFTYASLGSMKEGAKQGAYGLVARVYSSKSSSYVTLRYRNLKKYIASAVKIEYE